MNVVDIRTLALAASISAGVFLLVPLMLMVVLDAEEDRSLRYWAAGGGVLGLASLSLALWGLDGNRVAITTSNTLAVLGLGWVYLASRRLLGLEHGKRYVYPVVAITLISGMLLTVAVPDSLPRVVLTSVALAAYPAMSAWLFVVHRRQLPSLVAYTTAAIFTAMAGVYVARTIGFARVVLFDDVTAAPQAVSSLPFFIELVFNTWWAAMLAIIVSARIQARLRAERDRAAEINRELLVLSTTDPLTALANRNRVDEVLGLQSRRASARGVPLSVIMADVDHFKRVNDEFGHPVGDEVLVWLAEILQASVRETDVVGRWGGEEFIIVLPETDVASAERTAERIRRTVSAADFGIDRQLTASLGVAGHGDRDDPARLVARADEALYAAKSEGRNRVRVG